MAQSRPRQTAADPGMSGAVSSGQMPAVHHPSGTGAVSSARGGHAGRSMFDTYELARVLSHYDIGAIEAIREFPRGSRKAPKLLIKTADSAYLLKRRAPGKDDPFKVAFCHGLQMHLADKQFPLPHLIGTRESNNSMLRMDGQIYELFEYIKGAGYDNSLEATADSGKVLSLFHKLLSDYEPDYEPARGSYHASRAVVSSLQSIPKTLSQTWEGFDEHRSELQEALNDLYKSYNDAGRKVNESGFSDWPMQIVHSDWHPGNMLFRGSRIVAVIDYDAARILQRVTDIANGALQFSILGGGEDPGTWPDYLDESRFKRFLEAYDAVPDSVLSRAELRVIPWLMIEALIAEAAIPIAATGQFGRMEGLIMLQMIRRKIAWLRGNAERLAGVLG